MDSVDSAVRQVFDNLKDCSCPIYEQCASTRGGVLPWYFCSMYGCNSNRGHSAFDKITGVNGFKGSRDEVLESMRREAKSRGFIKS